MWRGEIWMFVGSGFAELDWLCMVMCGVGCSIPEGRKDRPFYCYYTLQFVDAIGARFASTLYRAALE